MQTVFMKNVKMLPANGPVFVFYWRVRLKVKIVGRLFYLTFNYGTSPKTVLVTSTRYPVKPGGTRSF